MSIIKNFENYKKNIQGDSNGTITQYLKLLNNFFKYLDLDINKDEDILKITTNDIKKWIDYLTEKENKPRTKNKSIAIIKLFYNYIYLEEDKPIDSKILFLKKSKVPKEKKIWLNEEQCEELLSVINNKRMKAFVSILMHTGARFSEVASIKMGDIKDFKILIKGKGNKERYIYIKECIDEVEDYIDTQRKHITKRTKTNETLLFLSDNGNKIDHTNFVRSLQRWAKIAGLDNWNKITPHVFRHSFISNSLEKGASISVVRDSVGHSNISTTNIYAHTNEKEIERLMNGGF